MGLSPTHLADEKAKADNIPMCVQVFSACKAMFYMPDLQNNGPTEMPVPKLLKSVAVLGYKAKGNSGCRWK